MIKKKAVFFDRDGVLNQDKGYTHRIEDLVWIKGAKKSIKFLKDKGFMVIVVSNQSGVSRGYFFEKDVKKFHNFMNLQLKKTTGATIDDFFYATDHPSNINSRRKPNPTMLIEAIDKYKINKKKCFLLGDKKSDTLAAKKAGIPGFLFKGGDLFDKILKILKELELNS